MYVSMRDVEVLLGIKTRLADKILLCDGTNKMGRAKYRAKMSVKRYKKIK